MTPSLSKAARVSRSREACVEARNASSAQGSQRRGGRGAQGAAWERAKRAATSRAGRARLRRRRVRSKCPPPGARPSGSEAFSRSLALVAPREVDGLEQLLVGSLGIAREAGQLGNPAVQVREAQPIEVDAGVSGPESLRERADAEIGCETRSHAVAKLPLSKPLPRIESHAVLGGAGNPWQSRGRSVPNAASPCQSLDCRSRGGLVSRSSRIRPCVSSSAPSRKMPCSIEYRCFSQS